jgi:hypothetical protein
VVSSVSAPFAGPVVLTATGLPSGATYSFTPATVTPGTAGANSTLTVSVHGQTAGMASRDRSGGKAAILAAMLVPLALLRRRRMVRFACLAALGIFGSALMTGCGTGGYFSQTQQTYTIQVIGTNSSLVHSTTVTLTVQ